MCVEMNVLCSIDCVSVIGNVVQNRSIEVIPIHILIFLMRPIHIMNLIPKCVLEGALVLRRVPV